MQPTLADGRAVGALGQDIGTVAAITGTTGFLAVAALTLFFVVGGPFGSANDVLNGALGVASAVLAVLLYRALGGSVVTLGLVLAGAALTTLGSWLVLSGTTGFQLAGFVSGVGFALIGAWLLTAVASEGLGASLSPWSERLGWVAGAIMLVGLLGLAGVVLRIDAPADTPWWLWLYGFGWLGTYVLYPIWCILLWRSA
jgi:hypothetical protein